MMTKIKIEVPKQERKSFCNLCVGAGFFLDRTRGLEMLLAARNIMNATEPQVRRKHIGGSNQPTECIHVGDSETRIGHDDAVVHVAAAAVSIGYELESNL